jgi:hypothetical protein
MLAHSYVDTGLSSITFDQDTLKVLHVINLKDKKSEKSAYKLNLIVFLFDQSEEVPYFSFLEYSPDNTEKNIVTLPVPTQYFQNSYDLSEFQRKQIESTAHSWELEFIQLLNLSYWCWRSILYGEKNIEFEFDSNDIEPPYWYKILRDSRERPQKF